MARNKVKKEKPPVRLLGTMFLLVLGLVAVYVGMALGIFTLVQRLVHLEDASYTLLWPILILSVSAILGVLLPSAEEETPEESAAEAPAAAAPAAE